MTKFVNEAAVKAGVDAAQKGYEQFTKLTNEQLKKAFPGAADKFEQVADFNKGNFEAVFAAGQAAAKAFEKIGQEFAALNQSVFETNLANATALMACKSVQEAALLQGEQARTGFEKAVAEGSKLGELAAKATGEAIEPIKARVNEAVETFAKPLAA
ncbi:MAG: phasin family protein [Alphaproteobacteria bacterium]